MNPKTTWPIGEAVFVGNALLEVLMPFCSRIEIAGSIRRGKPEVGDIEILYIPKFESRPVDMFASELMSLADEQIDMWLQNGILAKRPSKVGVMNWGRKNKLGIHVPSGIPVDFFATTDDNWWVSLVIRTGSKDTNLRLTNGAIQRGRNLMAYGCGVTMRDGQTLQAHSEEEVFELCGVPYLQPKDR